MQLIENWTEIRRLFGRAFKSSFHYALATVDENGKPHITPIGSLILGDPGHGFYFEEFAQQLPRNLRNNKQVCVLAVNSSLWFWLRSLFGGRFANLPAIRLYGTVGEARVATEQEIKLWHQRVRKVRSSKGYAILWKNMRMVRDIKFTRVEPVHMGKMTHGFASPMNKYISL